MKLYLNGHNYKYAAEQMLLTLFPGERPEYPDAPPLFGEDALLLRLSVGPRQVTAHAVLTYGGAVYSRYARAPAPGPEAGQLEQDRVLQRVLKNAFYRAGTDALGREPPWGALTGVRPVKLPTRDLERGLTVREAERRLRELYHVSAPRRRLALDCAQASLAAKGSLAPGDVSLYVGIPFCPTRCAYCSFVSQSVERSFALVPPYVDALCGEISAGGEMVRRAGLRVRTFYMGGGTPTTLTAEQMDRVLTAFETSFDRTACEEITVEAGRPDTITAEKLVVLRTHGVTRVSVNPQTFEENVLRAIGRCHTAADIDRAMELVARCGFPHVNMDLIAGLPEDTAEGFRRSLDRCLTYGPDDITVHTLALKKGSRILTEGLRIPGAETVAEMLDYASPTLRTAGYRPYYLYRQKYMSGSFENIGWCRSGGECWYNVDIMSELCSILSFGAAGSTKMVVPGTNQIQRAFNVKYPTEYIQRPEKWQANQAAFAAFYEAL